MSTDAAAAAANIASTPQGRAIGRGSPTAGAQPSPFFDYLRNIPAVFSNHLLDPEPQRRRYPNRKLVLLALLAVCLVPRILIALRLGSICPDGILYIRLAQAWGEGRFKDAFDVMNLNIFPVLLMALHRLGLPWEAAGMSWGVLISSLAVLPLFGWVRRQFDDAVAVAACLLYAVQPVFIQWSPELIRDPTFWFFFALSLYLLWRAVLEVRLSLSLAAGLAVALAVLTRFEGLFLLIPLGFWTLRRYRVLARNSDKIKLAVCAALALLAFPTLLLLVNLALMGYYSQWVFSRFAPLALVHYWFNGTFFPAPLDAANGALHGQPSVSFGRMLAIFVPALVKGLSPLFALLMLGGMWKWRRVWLHSNQQPLFYTGLVVMLAAWIHAWCARESCDRYFLPMVIIGSAFAGLGLLALSGLLLCWVERLKSQAALRYAAVLAPLAIVALTGWNAAFSRHYERRLAEVELAAWVRQQFGPSAKIFGSEGVAAVVAYYADTTSTTLWKKMDDAAVVESVGKLKPDVILLSATRRPDLSETRHLIERIETLDYAEIERSALPHGTDDVLVVLRRGHGKPPACAETGATAISRK